MTLSLYSTFKAWRRDVAAERGPRPSVAGAASPSSLQTALTLFGLGVGGVGGGGDQPMSDHV